MPKQSLTFTSRLAYGVLGAVVGLVPGVVVAMFLSWLQGEATNFAVVVFLVAAALGLATFVLPSLALLVVEGLFNFVVGLLNGVGGGTVAAPDRHSNRPMRVIFWIATAGAVVVLVYLQFRYYLR